ncbi:hypothetical protein FB479_106195 [Brevibacillus sp. AG162]|uniref:hypothetical protein n=1 Tax=Brevibacillus sp. AG162 TaxID=2572910 RepID=UPI001168F25B|nr:hypothetical protein [Brevibacillus sp. AG162]TQK62112.1 hypothetical protein FB479_106195 [Brevibacillus sp. AG162]
MATVGQQLSAPEAGWKRYDDAGVFAYSSGWETASTSNAWKGSYKRTSTIGATVKFLFKGTKIRIVTIGWSNRFKDSKLTIDGVDYNVDSSLSNQDQILVLEVLGLPNIVHQCVFTTGSNGSWGDWDAVDIDADGRLFHPDEVTDSKDLSVGKRIRFNYLASPGIFGTLSIGKELGEFLPVIPASNNTANGDGYFIMLGTDHKGDKLLLADRNIQNLSWDVMNNCGIASGSGLPITGMHTIPFLSGYSSSACAVSASTEYDQTSYNAWKAFDGSDITYWTSTSATEITESILSIVYSTPTKITSYHLHAKYSPKRWVLEASNDGFTWDILHSGEELTSWHDSKKSFSFNNNKDYTRYRIKTLERHVWNGLYYNGFYSVQLFTAPEQAMVLRLPTGGISASDKDNEWDKYITDDQIWNNVNHGSWTSTTDQSNSKARVIRGYNGLKNWTSGSTDLTTPGRGFRPVLLIESINNRFLILDGTEVKTYTSSGWETVGSTPPTDDMFLNKGMPDLSTCAPFLKDLIDKSNLKILVSKPKREPTVAHLTAIPVPRIVKMKNDTSFLGVTKINSLTLSGTEKGVLRVAISTDRGTTWEAKQKNGSWATVDVTKPIEFKEKAMTIDDFNSISEWDEKIGQARNLRCAFYFEQSSSTDETSLDSLTMNVDLLDSWDMAMPGVDYKYGYNRNTNLRVLLLSDGDYKINVGSGGSSGSTITEVDGGTF